MSNCVAAQPSCLGQKYADGIRIEPPCACRDCAFIATGQLCFFFGVTFYFLFFLTVWLCFLSELSNVAAFFVPLFVPSSAFSFRALKLFLIIYFFCLCRPLKHWPFLPRVFLLRVWAKEAWCFFHRWVYLVFKIAFLSVLRPYGCLLGPLCTFIVGNTIDQKCQYRGWW